MRRGPAAPWAPWPGPAPLQLNSDSTASFNAEAVMRHDLWLRGVGREGKAYLAERRARRGAGEQRGSAGTLRGREVERRLTATARSEYASSPSLSIGRGSKFDEALLFRIFARIFATQFCHWCCSEYLVPRLLQCWDAFQHGVHELRCLFDHRPPRPAPRGRREKNQDVLSVRT